ncbi:MAG TPA: hypothetical protein VFD23_05370 [Clostridia bacterium]|nr:hypothetical protein [Clostridia bacterium]
MQIMDIASKAVCALTKRYGKKLAKKMTTPMIPEVQPERIDGERFFSGFASAQIMPDLKAGKTYYIAGHGSGHVMEGVLTPVSVSAVWLDCGSGKGFVWVSADIIGLTRVEVTKIRGMLDGFSKRTGCKFINISCTHSHSGIDTVGYWGKPNLLSMPSDGKDPAYMAMLFDKICEVCEKAYENREPGKLYFGSISLPDAQLSKRMHGKLHDLLTRFRFVPDAAGNETWIVNYGGHPNTLGGANRLLSAEYPYFLRETVSEGCGANVLFGIGATGALGMAHYDDDTVENIKKQGKTLGEAAMSIESEKELKAEITLLSQPFYMPIDNCVLTLLAMRGTMNTDVYPDSRGEVGIALKSEMTYINIGGQQILMLPGEMFTQTVYGGYQTAEESATGKGAEINPPPLAEVAGDKNLLIFGVSNDMTGYAIPENEYVLHPTQPFLSTTKDRFGENHYHETNSMGILSQRVIVDEFSKIMARVRD